MKHTTTEKSQRRYLRKIKQYIPYNYHNRKQLLDSISDSIKMFSNTNDDITYTDLVNEFGEPAEHIASLIDEYSPENILSNFKKIVIFKIALLVCAVLIIALGSYSIYKRTHPGFYIKETIIIRDGGILEDFEFDE